MKLSQKEYESFVSHQEFMANCCFRQCAFPKFHIFETVKFIPDDIIGYVSGISIGETMPLEDGRREITGWFYDITVDHNRQYFDVPEGKVIDPLEDDE